MTFFKRTNLVAAFLVALPLALSNFAPAFCQTSLESLPDERAFLVASTETGASAPSTTYADGCPTPSVLAKSAYAVTCETSQAVFFRKIYDACTGGRRSPDMGCAAVVYVVDPELDFAYRKELSLPLTMTVKIGKVASVGDDLSTLVATVVNSNGSAEQLTPERLINLLAPIRIDERVLIYAKSGTGTRFDQKRSLDRPVRYYPALFLDAKAAKELKAEQHLRLPVQVLQDLEKLLNPRCLIYKLSC